MTDINDSAVLDTLIEQTKFAIYRYRDKIFVLSCNMGSFIFHSWYALNGKKVCCRTFRIANLPCHPIRPIISSDRNAVGQKRRKRSMATFSTNKQEE
jgi:hypothetical protein